MRQSPSLKVAVLAALVFAGCQQPGGGADAGAPAPGTGGKAPGTGGKAPGTGGTQPGGTGGAQPGGTGGAPEGTGGSPAGTGGRGGRDAAAETPPPPPTDTAPAPDASSSPNPDLDRVCTPRVTLKLEDKGPNGQLFTDAAGGNPEPFLQNIGRAVCRVLYRQASEVRNASHLELLIKDDPGVAWKAGDGSDITVMISTRHLANVKREGRDVAFEIKGILYHEMTHMYQHDDSDGNGVDIGFIEGIADFVRYSAGFGAEHWGKPSRGGSWREGYTRAAFFLDWIEKKQHPNFVYKLNLTMDSRDNKKWSQAAFQEITGKTVDQLWTEYQASF